MTEYKRITEIAHDAIHDDAFHGPRMFYAWDACEDSPNFVGPCASVAEALEAYVEEFGDDDFDGNIDVTLARPAQIPALFGISERLGEMAYDYGEAASERFDLTSEEEHDLDAAVNDAVRRWFDKRGGNPLAGWFLPYGRTLETTAEDAREWLAKQEGAKR
jgi:hypothetical protein